MSEKFMTLSELARRANRPPGVLVRQVRDGILVADGIVESTGGILFAEGRVAGLLAGLAAAPVRPKTFLIA